MITRLLVAAALVALLSVPAQAQSKQPSAADAKQMLSQGIGRYEEAFNKKDADTLAKYFTSDAVLVGVDGSVAKGREQIKQVYAMLFKGPLKDIDDQIAADEFHLLGSGAWATGSNTLVNKTNGNVVSKGHWAAIYRIQKGQLVLRMLSVGSDLQRPAKATEK